MKRSRTLHRVIAQFEKREKVGLKKYKVTVDRKDLTPHKWAEHLKQELMDAVLYLQRWQDEQSNRKGTNGNAATKTRKKPVNRA